MNDLISIIIPVYNVEKYIEKCIQSVLQQTYENLEIIIVDDGSPDSSPEICKKYVQKDSRIKLFHKQNGGLSDARNYGLEHAHGRYVYFLDSDDYIIKDAIEQLYQPIAGKDNEISVMNFYTVWKDKKEINKNIILGEFNQKEALLYLLQGKISNYAWDKLYPIELWKDIKFPVGKIFEDTRTTYKVFNKAKRVKTLDYAGYCYVQRPGSITDNDKYNRTEVIEAFEEQLAFARANCKDAVPYIEYRIHKINIHKALLDKEKNRNEIMNKIKNFKRFIKKNYKLLLTGEFESKNKKVTLSVLLLLICPSLYIFIYRKHRIKIKSKK